MDLNELLKQFKNIEPDKDYSRRSLNLILNSTSAPARKPTIREMFFKSVEFGAAVALAGLLIFVIAGGFSSANIPPSLQVSNLDPATLKAEAQAIDMQIQLINLNYATADTPAQNQNESTAPVASSPKKSVSITEGLQGNASGTASSTSLSVDEALQQLSK